MEYGFYHPEQGYWQAISEVPQEILDSYPEGTISVPLRPDANHQWKNGAWVYVAPEPLSDTELAEQARFTRDRLLAESDWSQLADAQAAMGSAKALEWGAYRQALRDVPQQLGFPSTIEWPVKP
jgi:hypothetical protein